MIGLRFKTLLAIAAVFMATAALRAAPGEPQDAPAPIDRDDLPSVEPYSPVELKFDRAEPMPPELTDVDISEQLGETIDLDLTFTDTQGRLVKLSQYFDGDRPVILNLTYFRCPMSCPVILNNLALTLRELELEPGEDYRVVTVSFDPTDSVASARKKQEQTLETLGHTKEADAADWPFLVGPAQSSHTLAEQVGYGFNYLPGPNQYTHMDVVMVLSPEGKVTRYLYGRDHPPMTMQLSLVEAAEGKVGSALDQVRLFCFYYTGEKKYALAAKRLMTAGGAVTVLALSGVMGVIWLRERRKAKPADDQAD
ncbi:MAG: SCO family protein [Planctomycetes bacterium]|jgi:protein SCO1/2|nr:SCO family protein [Planctomycetota bacterium]